MSNGGLDNGAGVLVLHQKPQMFWGCLDERCSIRCPMVDSARIVTLHSLLAVSVRSTRQRFIANNMLTTCQHVMINPSSLSLLSTSPQRRYACTKCKQSGCLATCLCFDAFLFRALDHRKSHRYIYQHITTSFRAISTISHATKIPNSSKANSQSSCSPK